jgi:deoxyribodipyrimidine photo-lyase
MLQPISIFWFRRDLRLNDNAGLYHALRGSNFVLPIFIFDSNILESLEEKKDKRVHFIHNALCALQEQLIGMGSTLHVLYSTPIEVFKQLTGQYNIQTVYTNHDYEPYAIKRDKEIGLFLSERNILLHTFKDQVIFEKDEVVKDNKEPYTVFTPYSRKWKEN